MGREGSGIIAPMKGTILYVDCHLESGIGRMRLAGLRRYAAARGWGVVPLEHAAFSTAAVKEAIARFRPVGCAAECGRMQNSMRPALFGRTPVVYFEPPDWPEWRGVAAIDSDNAAVARMAFRELSAANPPAYAVVTYNPDRRWTRERVDAFRACCREAGSDCICGSFPGGGGVERDRRRALLPPWIAALPDRCAIFAVSGFCSRSLGIFLLEAGRSFPRTVTLIGADGDGAPPSTAEVDKLVSTVRLDFELSGYLAAKALGEMALCGAAEPRGGGKAPPAHGPAYVIPPLLVERRRSTRGYGRREPNIIEAMDIIRREACEGLTAAQLAGRFPGTRRLFDLRFREAMGHPPLDEILHVRMQRVLDLLARPSFPLSAIAAFSGFRSERELQKLFRLRYKMSMREWRKKRQ